jgi:hypothetical protein
MMADDKITYPHGFFFPTGGLVFGSCILVISIPMMINPSNVIGFCMGITVACVGGIFFSRKGFEIDLDTKSVRTYTRVLGLVIGKSISLTNFKFITIINQTYGQSSFSRAGAELKSNFSTYNLLLLNETHHLKQFVDSFGTYDSALLEAQKLSNRFKLDIVKFDPVRTRPKKK